MSKEIEAIMLELECSKETAEEISEEMNRAETEQGTATGGALEMTDEEAERLLNELAEYEEGVINAMYDYYYGD